MSSTIIKHCLQRPSYPIISRRFQSTTPNNTVNTKNLAKLLILPISSNKSYVHFKYNDTLLNKDSPLVKYENKLANLASKGWNKLKDSDKSYNKKIVHYVTKFLERTPWSEDSLRSIPSTSALLRETQTQDLKNIGEGINQLNLISSYELQEKTDTKVLEIPVFYPSSVITDEALLKSELLQLSKDGESYHKKQMLWNFIGIPFTLPFIILPVIPNIPGFYLAYRFYCNFKAYLGAQHLNELLNQNHLLLKPSSTLDSIYKYPLNSKPDDISLLLNEDIIDKVVSAYELEDIKHSLVKTLKQERQKRQTLEEKST